MERIDILNKQIEYLRFKLRLNEHVLFFISVLLLLALVFSHLTASGYIRPLIILTIVLLLIVVGVVFFTLIRIKQHIDNIYKNMLRLMETRALKDSIYN